MKLFMLGMMMAMGGTAMAQQVTLTANDATDKNAGWTLSINAPQEIAGWQMELTLPEGVSLSSKSLTVGDATFTEYDGVKLPARYGAKYKAVGTPTENGVFLFFIPVAESYTASDFQISGNEGEACTITLIADSYDAAAAVSVKNVCAADADGNSISGVNADFTINHPKGDASGDFALSVTDMGIVLDYILKNIDTINVANSDASADGEITVSDMGVILDTILGK